MKVLFLKHVVNVWKEGEIKDVKPWYATNFLFPKNFAVELTPEMKKMHLQKLKKQDATKRELIENKFKLSEELNWKSLTFVLKTWSKWKIYGWVWEKDIINYVKKNFKIQLSKKHINMPDWHIKRVWESFIYINLWKDAMAKITVIVKWE